ncbi:RNA polymerase sigma factor (sigma-70 family) [Virgibacillus natechei]|uniref:RNA polymerase sigma factor (Sigma-70 family) n=1 Tax=Virgibacillus natechei TaxID=1216297 RepID=A0ABS4III4_9BACI|nr:sigma-70 family RNA polymerase sigma factor [Virgibacillus natechei]MBP1970758.1 RNA polymerase sigma factor (sigma-70 family) [Virgibacillus natechei]UZD12333.1 sigma-70 family RNA polymerase sigma factor [Virgibacillus natechei]
MRKQYLGLSFEEVVEQNEARIYYQLHDLRITDHHEEFYQEGLYAMWEAYQTYQLDKGSMGTYFNYMIRNRIIDLMRKNRLDRDHDTFFYHEETKRYESGNRWRDRDLPALDLMGIPIDDAYLWEQVKGMLTVNQWKWMHYYILLDMPIKEIATREGVSINAVKGWARLAKRRLMNTAFKDLVLDSM